MVRTTRPRMECVVVELLTKSGWEDVEIQRTTLLQRPFHHEDPEVLGCYSDAERGCGGLIIFSDPIK